jgi:multicomponent K+:H+ antiporter subunit A
MMSATRVMLPLALLVGIFMFLRGHNHPGGGFVAGLVITIALIMQYMVSGYQWAADRITIDYHGWIGTGFLIAAATGIAAMVMDYPFLTNAHEKFRIPGLGYLELSSALAFDAGVLLTVVGAVMLTLANLSRLGRRAEQAAQRAAANQRDVAVQTADGEHRGQSSGHDGQPATKTRRSDTSTGG